MTKFGWGSLTDSHMDKPRDFPERPVGRIWERPLHQGEKRGFQSLSGEQAGTECLAVLEQGDAK